MLREDEAARLGEEDFAEVFASSWWLPLKWSVELVSQAQVEGLLNNGPGYSSLLGKISDFRGCLTEVVAYGQIPVPLVYTQVVTLAVYVYFAVSLVGEQWTESEKLDIYYPVFMTIKFLFYFGWLRVAETLYNPFGEDDDDFEINDLLDRHFRVALAMVDDTEDPPVLQRDVFWDVTEAALDDSPPSLPSSDNVL